MLYYCSSKAGIIKNNNIRSKILCIFAVADQCINESIDPYLRALLFNGDFGINSSGSN